MADLTQSEMRQLLAEAKEQLYVLASSFLFPEDHNMPDCFEPEDYVDDTLDDVFIPRGSIRKARAIIARIDAALK